MACLGEDASAASAFADEYLAGVCGRAYEGWGLGSHTADKIGNLRVFFVCAYHSRRMNR